MPPATSARGRTATTSTDVPGGALPQLPQPPQLPQGLLELLRDGDLELLGRLVGSSNNAMVVRVLPAGSLPAADAADDAGLRPLEPGDTLAVWKPTRGERPLFDFPVGTL